MSEMQRLPADIIINIISRLPVKTLSRLRCVSTFWSSLISSPNFLSTHQDLSARQPLFLFITLSREDNERSLTIHLSSVDQQRRVLNTFTNKVACAVHCLHTCFDLVCLAGRECIYVCNPSTEEFLALPRASRPTNPRFAVGLGYSSSSKAYKVIHLFRYYSIEDEIGRCRVGCEVFTLGGTDSSWRRVEDCPYKVSGLYPPAFVEGSLHWLISGYSDFEVKPITTNNVGILSFIVNSEEFRVIPHPEFCSSFDRRRGQLRLGELAGCLCLLEQIQPSKLNIWMLKDYKNHVWVKEYTINLTPPGSCCIFLNPRSIRSDGAILMETPHRSLDYYDPRSGTFTKVDGIEVDEWFQFSYYVESFYSLGSR